jgi:hypothetical protein
MAMTLDMQEKCLWYYCETSKSKTYKIYNSTTTTNKPDYKATCSQILCNISYDNNRITISLGGEGKKACILEEEFIKSDCPSITVTVPDDTFSVVDSINSECSNNNIKPNRAKINDSHPSWDIITETRTCVLGYLLYGGNKNVDGPIGIGGSAGVPISNCGNMVASPIGSCGKSGDDSRPWTTYIGNTRVVFPLATSNGQTAEYLYREWESDMRQVYNNIAACKNSIPGDIANPYINRTYDVGDIVEGIVPGTCSFKIGSIDYPSVSYRAPAAVTNGTVSVKVAYYTYSYKRPKNIQDILIGGSSKKCNERTSQRNDVSMPKITSNYDTPTCSDTPICYDTDVSKCSSLDYCCQANK